MRIIVNNQTYIVSQPDYPYSFETHIVSDDVQTLDGTVFSMERFRKKSVSLNFSNLGFFEVKLWRQIYNETQGFRKPFEITDIFDESKNITMRVQSGGGEFPFKMESYNNFSGTINLIEA